ncbi:MAG TPA: ATP synthase subunit I [Gammaproteobacteria bacterium]|nr:ATP synthase subunit I [Gammaproteobacteria bacterium]
MDARLRRLLSIQLLLIASAYVVFLLTSGRSTAGPVWFGGVIALANVWLLVRCARRRINESMDAARQTLWVAYSCAVTRFIAVAALFMLGMGILKLHPLAILMGFISGQLVLFFPQTRKLINY